MKVDAALSQHANDGARLESGRRWEGIVRLTECISALRALDLDSVSSRTDSRVSALSDEIDRGLIKLLGESTPEYMRARLIRNLDTGGLNFSDPLFLTEMREALAESIQTAIASIEAIIADARQELDAPKTVDRAILPDQRVPTRRPQRKPRMNPRKVFLAHGHDTEAKSEVARFLAHIGLEPIILSEQAGASNTIAERLDAASDVGFAVVLVTPDDVGALATEERNLRFRGRQNVIYELGFLHAKLGRNHVFVLAKGDVELPSDLSGILSASMGPNVWQGLLARELDAAGLRFDLRKVFRI